MTQTKTAPVPRACRRKVTWGEYLRLAVGHRLKPAVAAIAAITGPSLGVRNTFAPLFEMERSPLPRTKEYDRAYALILAIGGNPADWGIDEREVAVTLVRCRDLLFDASGWPYQMVAHAA